MAISPRPSCFGPLIKRFWKLNKNICKFKKKTLTCFCDESAPLPPPTCSKPLQEQSMLRKRRVRCTKNNNLFYFNDFFFSFIRVCMNDHLRNLCVNLYILNGNLFSVVPMCSIGPTWHFPTSCPSNRKLEKQPVLLAPASSCLRVKVWLQTFQMMPNPSKLTLSFLYHPAVLCPV